MLKGFLLALTVWMAVGCATTAGTVKAAAERVEVCINSRCERADAFDRESLIAGLLAMFKANENSHADICTLDRDGQACESNAVRWFLQGGPIPGVATYGEPYIYQVALDKNTMEIKFLMDAKARWIGTPLLCSDAAFSITVASPWEIIMEGSPVCTWLAFPGVYNMKFFIRRVDFDRSTLTGEYSVGGAGLLNLGGGSNPFRLTLPNSNTLVVRGETRANLPRLANLPPAVLSLAVPMQEEVQKIKQEVNEEERNLWEKVARKNTISAYREYLTRYPEGRFRGAALAQIKVIEEREAQDRDLEYWDRIKDSKDPRVFEEYVKRFPGGLFADTATTTVKRLRVSASVASALAAEDALWEKVKGSTDPVQISSYLDVYPQGFYSAQARRRLESIRAAEDRKNFLELRLWEQIKDSRQVEDFKNYLQVYPDGLMSELAKARLETLVRMKAETEEMVFWKSIRDSSRPEDFREYLRRYPQGKYAELSRMLAKQFEDLRAEREELELWETVKNSREPSDFDRYLDRYAKGRFAEAAIERRSELIRERESEGVDFGRYYALIIGNDDYQSFSKLKTAVRDAEAVAHLLKNEYGYEVKVLKNTTRKDILGALSGYRRQLSSKDNLLVFYAGHGSLDRETGRGYWLPVDAETDSPANWISTHDVSDALKAMAAKHIMVVADSCYGGTLTRGVRVAVKGSDYLRRLAEKRARVVLTSGGVEPVLDEGGGGHSVFTRVFLDVLEKNRGVMEGTRLFEELRRPVVLNAPQTPEYSDILYAGHEGGDFLFIRVKKKGP